MNHRFRSALHRRWRRDRATALVIVALAALLGATDALQASPSGAPMIARECFECHGENGISSNPIIPIIAGHSDFAIIDHLLSFAAGDRPCVVIPDPDGDSPPTSMCEIAKALDETEIEALAEYFAALPFEPQPQVTDPDWLKRGQALHEDRCERCHTEGGSQPEDDAAILAGQWMPYLQRAISDFASGRRTPPENMKPKLEGLSEDDINALAHFYASRQ